MSRSLVLQRDSQEFRLDRCPRGSREGLELGSVRLLDPGDNHPARVHSHLRSLAIRRHCQRTNPSQHHIHLTLVREDIGDRDPALQLGEIPSLAGVEDLAERLYLLGGSLDSRITPAIRPSYYAQLEILAQKIYQDPEFFTDLYDKPANVLRKDVAMQAVNLMLERDMHKSELRSEMVLAVWLEMELMKYQRDVQNRLNALEERYEAN